MRKSTKITLSIVSTVLITAIFVASCTCTYMYHLNTVAFWWSWIAIVWLTDIFVGGYIFYKPNRTDETKIFWLLTMIVIPVSGAAIALIYNYKLKTEYGNPNNDHSILQAAIFRAKKSIKIYSNSFLASADTYKALNFARWKGVDIQLILSLQEKKSKQHFLITKLQKSLEKKIKLNFIDKQIVNSFIIIDDEYVITTEKNFNFRYIYTEKNLVISSSIGQYLSLWDNDLSRTSQYSLKKTALNPILNVTFKIVNIFYPFF